MLIYGIPGIHAPVFIETLVFGTAYHQKCSVDFNNLNTKLKSLV